MKNSSIAMSLVALCSAVFICSCSASYHPGRNVQDITMQSSPADATETDTDVPETASVVAKKGGMADIYKNCETGDDVFVSDVKLSGEKIIYTITNSSDIDIYYMGGDYAIERYEDDWVDYSINRYEFTAEGHPVMAGETKTVDGYISYAYPSEFEPGRYRLTIRFGYGLGSHELVIARGEFVVE